MVVSPCFVKSAFEAVNGWGIDYEIGQSIPVLNYTMPVAICIMFCIGPLFDYLIRVTSGYTLVVNIEIPIVQHALKPMGQLVCLHHVCSKPLIFEGGQPQADQPL